MTEQTAISLFWQQLGEVLTLHPTVFEQINLIPQGSAMAAIVVLAAGLSQVAAQSVVLFANRVQPVRFVLTSIVGVLLFVCGYFFLVLSTWALGYTPFSVQAPLDVIARTLAISYAPLIFSVLGAMPYLGNPILSLLSVWQLLGFVVGFAAVAHATLWQAFGTVGLGWLLLRILQRTVGQPIANLGYWLACQVAGVELVTQQQSLSTGLQQNLRAMTTTPDRLIQAAATENIVPILPAPQQPIQYRASTSSTINPTAIARDRATANSTNGGRQWKLAAQWGGFLLLLGGTFITIVLLSPIRDWWFAWSKQLSGIFELGFNLVWIGVIALIAAALIAPWETLGWWAGWYGDRLDSQFDDSVQSLSTPTAAPIMRYIVYLDGIGQSTLEYLSDSQAFVDALAQTLPQDMQLIEGIMPYSVRNNPLTSNRPLAFFWRLADRFRLKNPASIFGYFVNLRNVLMVAVSADKRYGPIYNFGIARIIYQTLIQEGYDRDRAVPITLVGFSGGGQMAAGAAPFLREVLTGPIELISLGGVISGNINILSLSHLYHLVGDKDGVERIGPTIFPGRWKIFFLSYWNRARRMGKVQQISLGSVGHQVPGGLMDPQQFLPDGRSYLQQTLDRIAEILQGTAQQDDQTVPCKLSNYELYQQADFNRSDFYPLDRAPAATYYRPIAPWMGRLILPTLDQRQSIQGVLLEIHHAPAEFQHLVGEVVMLRWSRNPRVQQFVRAVTKDVHFSPNAEYSSQQGQIHPTRLNHWRQVDPLESIAGSHPTDDVIVMLPDPVVVEQSAANRILRITHEPVQISGRYYGLVRFVRSMKPDGDRFLAVHFNRESRQFTGAEEIVRLPQVVPNINDTATSTSKNIATSVLNEAGWYIYGAMDRSGQFVVQAIAPRRLLQVEVDQQIVGQAAVKHYLKHETWHDLATQKGTSSQALLQCNSERNVATWQEGSRALLLHVYGGIGGKKTEPAAKSPLYFGHFAYGIATVVREPLTEELRFDITYYQIYTHNNDGLIAGSLHWSRYMGDRQYGWLGLRPVADTLIELDAFTGEYETEDGSKRSPLDSLIDQLEIMAARYRIGDGTGGTFVGPAYNCNQDSNQALYAAIQQITQSLRAHPNLAMWTQQDPDRLHRLEQLEQLGKDLKWLLLPWGTARADWQNPSGLGSTLEDHPLQQIARSLLSWRTILPRLTSDEVTQIFIRQGGSARVLRTNQVGGTDPAIAPIAPMTL